jgi:phytoene desaturase
MEALRARIQAQSKTVADLYYVGASTAPGNGLPMVLISAELAIDRLQRDGHLTL